MSLFGNCLFTPRLSLRRIRTDDLPILIAWSRSEEAYGKYLTPEFMQHEDVAQRVESGVFWNDHEKLFVIVRRDEELPIGTIHYWKSASGPGTATMALKIAIPDQRGKGFGLEAQKYVIIYLFERAGMDTIEMYTDINNKVQQHCLKKLGFEIVESLTYTDQQVQRIGHLYRLDRERYQGMPFYQYHEI